MDRKSSGLKSGDSSIGMVRPCSPSPRVLVCPRVLLVFSDALYIWLELEIRRLFNANEYPECKIYGPAPQAANINIGYIEAPNFKPKEEDIEDYVEEFKTRLVTNKVPKGNWTKALVRRLPLDGRKFIKCRFESLTALEDVLEVYKLRYPRNDGRAHNRGTELRKMKRHQSTVSTGKYLIDPLQPTQRQALWALAPKDCLLLAAAWSTTRNPEEAEFLQMAKFLDEANKWDRGWKEASASPAAIPTETATRTAEEQAQGQKQWAKIPTEKARRFMLPDGTPRPKIGTDDHVVELNEEQELKRLGANMNDRKNSTQKYCVPDDLEIASHCKTRVKLKRPTVMVGILEPHPDGIRKTGLLISSVHVSEPASKILIDVINIRNKPVRLVGISCMLRSGGRIANVSFQSEQAGYSMTAMCKYEPHKFDINPEVLDSEKINVLDVLYTQWLLAVPILDETSKPITSFTTGNGLYEFQVLLFGLTGKPCHFERIMDTLLAKLKWSECIVYLDDVIVYGKDICEHKERFKNVLECSRRAGLSLKSSKCRIAYQKLPILGHVVSENGIEPATDKIEVVKEFPSPENVKQESILAHFNPEARRLIHMVGLGAVLMQPDKEGFLHAVHYLSRTMSKHECKYGISELECLAIVWALHKLRLYIFGRSFRVVTDHSALTWLANVHDPCSRLMRWGLKMMEYDFKIVHRAGRKNVAPDALSCNPFYKTNARDEENFNELAAWTVCIDENTQRDDQFCCEINKKMYSNDVKHEFKTINDVDLHAASPVMQNKQGCVQDLDRGFCPIGIIQSPPTSTIAASKQLSILKCNINGLSSTATKIRLEEIMEIFEKQKIQIIALQETKLNEKYKLNILRKDRNNKGGGLAFLIKNLYYEDIVVNIPKTSDLKAQGIKTKTCSIKEKFWNFKKANWNLYQQNTNEDFEIAPTRIKYLEKNWISFKNTIIKAAKVSIPRENTDLNMIPGSDGIHGRMISNLGKNGKERLLYIFNNSWKTGKLPQDWKTAKIIPIKKLLTNLLMTQKTTDLSLSQVFAAN
ncbi:K02A2.6-like [Cordylochernes scorpioides]|uniref:K02A2.6-like n=1 Tax=Cordylochernes scorpioides TaxID=51811 RepID=A0ABY6LSY4_9ARAC|nr:K02A2.6-like [Cordylochernes scorpioides]